jgi:phosphoserine phosphatase RsbU/P
VTTPHVQLILDDTTVPPPLQAALQRVNARVSVRSLRKALSSGVSETADLCVILPGATEQQDVLATILNHAADKACATMVMPAVTPSSDRAVAPSDGWSTDELTGRIKALCEIRRPMREMRAELVRLRARDAALSRGAQQHDEQLRLAGQIQLDLLPEPIIEADPLSVSTLFLPADYVSGDIYDVSRLDEDHFSFSIADATGHGVPAALLTFLIKNSLRGKEIAADSYRILEPDEVLRRLNQELVSSDLSQCHFVTGLHAVFERPARRLRWARGGAPYPVLLRPGELPRQLRSAGGLVGAFENQKFEIATHTFEQGDTLLLYTDGLEALLLGRERSCGDGAILEVEWLKTLSIDGPDAALARLGELAADANSDWPKDDITAIALKLN